MKKITIIVLLLLVASASFAKKEVIINADDLYYGVAQMPKNVTVTHVETYNGAVYDVDAAFDYDAHRDIFGDSETIYFEEIAYLYALQDEDKDDEGEVYMARKPHLY
ncbi:MAG: hypothetical protein ISR65_11525 [Bacteriovoracaceae bacterium]|nr:hypothetical protein [Bacteriovoracaceae bacterium]